jgi:hypothetical protein
MRNSAGASQLMDGSGRTAKPISYLSGNKKRTGHSCLPSLGLRMLAPHGRQRQRRLSQTPSATTERAPLTNAVRTSKPAWRLPGLALNTKRAFCLTTKVDPRGWHRRNRRAAKPASPGSLLFRSSAWSCGTRVPSSPRWQGSSHASSSSRARLSASSSSRSPPRGSPPSK